MSSVQYIQGLLYTFDCLVHWVLPYASTLQHNQALRLTAQPHQPATLAASHPRRGCSRGSRFRGVLHLVSGAGDPGANVQYHHTNTVYVLYVCSSEIMEPTYLSLPMPCFVTRMVNPGSFRITLSVWSLDSTGLVHVDVVPLRRQCRRRGPRRAAHHKVCDICTCTSNVPVSGPV